MKQPVTELDTRFSDQDAVATDWEETRRALEEAELFWISTVRTNGRPHVTPLPAVWRDGALYFCTGPGEQKALNLRALIRTRDRRHVAADHTALPRAPRHAPEIPGALAPRCG